MEIFVAISIVRILAGLLIFKWPLFGILLSALLDGYDWDFLHTAKDFNYDFYQTWDKTMDITYLTIAAFTIRRWKDTIARNIALFFYGARVTGVVLFFILQIKPLLFFFPNVFEHFFIWYLLFEKISKKSLPHSLFIISVILLFIVVPKLFHEYTMHVNNMQLWNIIDFNIFDSSNELVRQYANWLGWGSLLYIIPFGLAIFFAQRAGKER